MKKNTIKSFSEELEKTSAIGLIGDILAASLIASLAMTAAQHGKGMWEAKKAGAKFRDLLKSHPLPLGAEWKYRPFKLTKGRFKIPTKSVYAPFKDTTPYEFNIRKQQDLARTLGMPAGAIFSEVSSLAHPRLSSLATLSQQQQE